MIDFLITFSIVIPCLFIGIYLFHLLIEWILDRWYTSSRGVNEFKTMMDVIEKNQP